MTATVSTTPLLDGPRRGIFIGVVVAVLALITIDGALNWTTAADADAGISAFEAAHADTYPTGLGDTGRILSPSDRREVAAQTDGDRLDRDHITATTWLVTIGLIAAIGLAIASGPGSSRNTLATLIVGAAAMWFVPLVVYADTIDIVTTAHGG